MSIKSGRSQISSSSSSGVVRPLQKIVKECSLVNYWNCTRNYEMIWTCPSKRTFFIASSRHLNNSRYTERLKRVRKRGMKKWFLKLSIKNTYSTSMIMIVIHFTSHHYIKLRSKKIIFLQSADNIESANVSWNFHTQNRRNIKIDN